MNVAAARMKNAKNWRVAIKYTAAGTNTISITINANLFAGCVLSCIFGSDFGFSFETFAFFFAIIERKEGFYLIFSIFLLNNPGRGL